MIDTTLLTFIVLAVASVASALGAILFRNAVHSALSLILTLLFLALFYLQLGAMFLAIVQILIYAGAIMVLFLFVITLLGLEEVEDLREPLRFQREASVGLAIILAGSVAYLIREAKTTDFLPVSSSFGSVQNFGYQLFTTFAFPFELTAILILVAIVGAVVLGRGGR